MQVFLGMAFFGNGGRNPFADNWQLWIAVAAGVAFAVLYEIAVHVIDR